jgi:hypothetical protein
MQINATNHLTPLPERARPVAEHSTEAQDAATFSDAKALDQKVRETADVRAEAVALARSLIAAPTYPPEKTIRGIANLLASNLQSQDE